jgi:hypothetical protein
MSTFEQGYQDYIVESQGIGDKNVAKGQPCGEYAAKKAAHDKEFGGLDAGKTDWQTLQRMSVSLRDVQASKAKCDQAPQAFSGSVEALLGAVGLVRVADASPRARRMPYTSRDLGSRRETGR